MNQRFDRLEAQLATFLASPSMGLWWVVEPEELGWIDVFLKKAKTVKVVDLASPCVDPQTHGYTLAAELVKKQGSVKGPDGPWVSPGRASRLDDTLALAAIAESLSRQIYEPRQKRLLLRFDITSLADARPFVAWISRSVEAIGATRVRVVVMDRVGSRAFERVSNPRAFLAGRADLSVDAMVEAMAEAQDLTIPTNQLRLFLLRSMHACKRGDLERAVAFGEAAVTVAWENGMPELGVPACFAVGAAYLAHHRAPDAVSAYRRAEELAIRASEAGHAPGPELRVLSRLGVGSALFAGGGYAHAGPFLMETAPLAAALPNLRLEVEAYRLAAQAFALAQSYRPAMDAGIAGLGAIARAPAEARPRAAARELGELLLRLTERGSLSDYRHGVKTQLAKLLGPSWQTEIMETTA